MLIGTHFLLKSSTRPDQGGYIQRLRPVCEIVYNLFLLAYIEALTPMTNKSKDDDDWDDWDRATKFAEEALEKSQDAEKLRQHNSIVEADKIADAALIALKTRYFCCRFLQLGS